VLGSDIYIFGGNTDNESPTSTTFCFHTETDEWATLAPMPAAVSGHNVSMLDSLIYVMGGWTSDENSISSFYRFGPVANLWSTVAPMSVARTALGSFVLGGEYLRSRWLRRRAQVVFNGALLGGLWQVVKGSRRGIGHGKEQFWSPCCAAGGGFFRYLDRKSEE
jgi:N-acetylneuraminic acid mutarotase